MMILPMSDISMTPTVSALLGTGVQSSVLDSINSQYGAGGVIFGLAGSPAAERYNALKSVVQDQLMQASAEIEEVRSQIVRPYEFVEICSEDQLRNIPAVMELPILMYAPVRKLLEEKRISGWNYESEFLPKEDFFGRLIDNGKVSNDPNDYADGTVPEHFTWIFDSTDPNLEFDQLKAIERSREWIGTWLKNEMDSESGGKWRDPTDLSNKISKISHVYGKE